MLEDMNFGEDSYKSPPNTLEPSPFAPASHGRFLLCSPLASLETASRAGQGACL